MRGLGDVIQILGQRSTCLRNFQRRLAAPVYALQAIALDKFLFCRQRAVIQSACVQGVDGLNRQRAGLRIVGLVFGKIQCDVSRIRKLALLLVIVNQVTGK